MHQLIMFLVKIPCYLCHRLTAFFKREDATRTKTNLPKGHTFTERFREIVSDPLNLLIERVEHAGFVDVDGNVVLHNGNKVPSMGLMAYYDTLSDILVINRGVHEPLEEYCFQELMKRLKQDQTHNADPTMIELGAYWAHYSMWMKRELPSTTLLMVEPDERNLDVGKNNFRLNGFEGEFINRFVSKDDVTIDAMVQDRGLNAITLLHSDIQGYEVEMLQNSEDALRRHIIDYLFISTHSDRIHDTCKALLNDHGYIVEVDSEPEAHSTSCDGFLFARSPRMQPLFVDFHPMGRVHIAKAPPGELVAYLAQIHSRVVAAS